MLRRLALSALLLFAAAAPLVAAKVRTGHDSTFDFSAVHTYRWKADEGPAPNEELDRRIRLQADEELAKKGLKRAGEGEAADVLLVYSVGSADMLVAGRTAVVGWYGDIWVVGAARSRMSGGILIEMQKPEDGQAVWGASWVQTGNNPDTLMLLVQDAERAVKKALARYPPKKK